MSLECLVESKDDLAVGETIEREALLLHPLHRPDLLLLLLGQLGQVEVEHREAAAGNIACSQTIHLEDNYNDGDGFVMGNRSFCSP